MRPKIPSSKASLDKRYARVQLPDGKLGELADLVFTVGFRDNPSVSRNVLVQVYEYFLGMVANAKGKRGGQLGLTVEVPKRSCKRLLSFSKSDEDAITHIETEIAKAFSTSTHHQGRESRPNSALTHTVFTVEPSLKDLVKSADKVSIPSNGQIEQDKTD